MRAAILLALAGCVVAPTIMAQTPRSVTLNNVNEQTVGKATDMAQKHCAQYDRDAELVPDSVPDGNATFKCVDRSTPDEK